VIRALAVCWDPFEVSVEASRLLASWGEGPVDVRTANWQRSSIVTKLGLPKTVSRMRALAVARERGLLEDVDLVQDDGSVPAVPPPTKVPGAGAEASAEPMMAAGPGPVAVQAVVEVVSRGVRPRGGRGAAVAGQLSFDDALAPAPVTVLFPATAPLEVAAGPAAPLGAVA
jgi:hypothetical protein